MWTIKQIGPGDKVTTAMYNEIVVRLNLMTKVYGRNISGRLTEQGFNISASASGGSSEESMIIYQIQSNSTGNGVYNCRMEIVDGSSWDSATITDYLIEANATEVKVFNLAENQDVLTWALATYYQKSNVAIETATEYRCLLPHLSAAANKPGSGASWATYWTTTVTDHVLAVGDRLLAWRSIDDDGGTRLVGIPLPSHMTLLEMLRDIFDEC